jgi:predicted ferric reductase
VYWIVRGAIWFGSYLTLILFPLIVGALFPGDAGGRPFALQFGIACGFVGLSVMSFEYALTSKMSVLAAAFGQEALLRFHKLMGLLAVLLLVIHVVLMMLVGYPCAAKPFQLREP